MPCTYSLPNNVIQQDLPNQGRMTVQCGALIATTPHVRGYVLLRRSSKKDTRKPENLTEEDKVNVMSLIFSTLPGDSGREINNRELWKIYKAKPSILNMISLHPEYASRRCVCEHVFQVLAVSCLGASLLHSTLVQSGRAGCSTILNLNMTCWQLVITYYCLLSGHYCPLYHVYYGISEHNSRTCRIFAIICCLPSKQQAALPTSRELASLLIS